MTTNKQRRTWQKPLTKTARIEVKCTEAEKDAIYAAALAAQVPVTRFLVDAAIEKINNKRGSSNG